MSRRAPAGGSIAEPRCVHARQTINDSAGENMWRIETTVQKWLKQSGLFPRFGDLECPLVRLDVRVGEALEVGVAEA